MVLSMLLAAFLALGSYESLPVTTEAPQDPVRVFTSSSRRSYIGVSIQTLTSKLAKANGNKVDEGALVNEVERKSPAEEAGLQEGDVVVQFGERMIYDADDLQKAVGKVKPGTKVNIKIDRKGSSQTLALTVGKNPRRMTGLLSRSGAGAYLFGSTKALGADLRPLNEQLGEYFQAPDGKGVLVESVKKDGAADKAGMKAGDVIVKVADERVEELGDLWEILSDYEEGEKVDIEVIRKGSSKKLTVELEKGSEGGHFYQFRTAPFGRWRNGNLGEDIRWRLRELPEIEFDRVIPELEELQFDTERLQDAIEMKIRPVVPKLRLKELQEKRIQHRI